MIQNLRKGIAVLLAILLLTAGLSVIPSFAVYAAPDEGGRVPYQYSFDKIHTKSHSDSRIAVFRNLTLALGQPIEAAGWLATDEGVAGYQYMWIPTGGGNGEWQDVTDVQISPRPDLLTAGIPYTSGHSTAGFTFTITPPADLAEGCYDVYIRALDGMGTPCDLAVLLNLRYGEPDMVSESAHYVSIPRIGREGEEALFGGSTINEGAVTLPPDGGVRLGDLNLAGFEALKITYELLDPEAEGKLPILGLKSAGAYSYGKGDEGYNMTHDLAYAPISADQNEVEIRLEGCDENGEVWLTGHLNCEIRITEIEFVCNGYGTDRVAARIQFSEDLISYFSQLNRTELKPVNDPVLGDVLRMEVREETNDPYAHFKAGALLKDHDIVLDADDYKYMVFLYRSGTNNNSTRMNLYLCSGAITGATEDCNQGVSLVNDGKWHYLLVDLTQRANWDGVINGWRFDYISANSDAGDFVDFASVQFFRTYDAALAAASRDPAKGEAFHAGDLPVIRDMSEEQGQEDSDELLSIDPNETYEVTEPPAEPPTEPPTDPAEETQTASPETTEDTTETIPETRPDGKGCRSILCGSAAWIALSFSALVLSKRKKSTL